jgi:tetratricopeptide (TPR) repeat protein
MAPPNAPQTAAEAGLLAQANQWLDRGEPARAAALLAPALAAQPGSPALLRTQGFALLALRRTAEAAARLRQALALQPLDGAAWNALGTALGEAGDLEGAGAAFARATDVAPGFAAAWYNLGKNRQMQARNDEAQAAFERALAAEPAFLPARFGLGEALLMAGRPREAAAQYRALLRQAPDSGLAWWGLASIKSVPLGEADVAPLEALVRRSTGSSDEALAARFALARVLDDVDRPAAAWEACLAANAAARVRFRWDRVAFAGWLARVADAFARAPAAPLDPALGSEIVFLPGMPRSGSTLVEQVLAAHPEVEGASELPDLGQVVAEESRRRGKPFPDWVGDCTAADWHRLGRRYLERTAGWRRTRPRSTDKMPGNWMLAGAIRAMLPGARIVPCRRDAVETCWSCLRQLFWSAHDYSYDLDDLAATLVAQERWMASIAAAAPGHVRTQDHEALLADPEGQVRALLDFCGLPFDPACLRFHEAGRSVRTASAAQVREPLRRSTAQAPRYGTLFDPIRAALARARSQP